MEWYYLSGEQQVGPMDEGALVQSVRDGVLGPEAMVWNTSMGKEWVKASTFPQLFPPPDEVPPIKPPETPGAPERTASAPSAISKDTPAREPAAPRPGGSVASARLAPVPVEEPATPTAAEEWYYLVADEQHGPVDGTALAELARDGKLKADDLVWNPAAGNEWVKAATVSDLFAKQAATAPPPPEPSSKAVFAANAPLRIAGIKVVTVVSAVTLLFVLFLLVGIVYGFTQSRWVVRALVLTAAMAYVGYVWWLSHPRLPLVTEEDRDPTSVRVYQSVARVTQRAGLPMPRLVIDPSKGVNAMTFGFSPNSAYIAVNEGLLDLLKEDKQLDAVIAHEVSHILNRDVAAGTAFNFVVMLAQGVHFLSSLMLQLGAQSAGCVGQLMEFAVQFGLIGAIVALAILFGFLYFMSMALSTFISAVILLFIAVLAVNAFTRQREKLADDFAAEIVGREHIALALVSLAEQSPEDRLMACQLLGMRPDAKTPIPKAELIRLAQAQELRFTWGARMNEMLADHPILLRRVRRVLAGSQKLGFFEFLIHPLTILIESSARWLTPEHRAAAVGPSAREGDVFRFGCVVGLVFAALAAILPPLNTWVACLGLGIPAGAVLGAGIAAVLIRRGPFLGGDVVDAVLTGALAWFLTATVTSGVLFLRNDFAALVASPVVLIVCFAAAAFGYAFYPPGALEEA